MQHFNFKVQQMKAENCSEHLTQVEYFHFLKKDQGVFLHVVIPWSFLCACTTHEFSVIPEAKPWGGRGG